MQFRIGIVKHYTTELTATWLIIFTLIADHKSNFDISTKCQIPFTFHIFKKQYCNCRIKCLTSLLYCCIHNECLLLEGVRSSAPLYSSDAGSLQLGARRGWQPTNPSPASCSAHIRQPGRGLNCLLSVATLTVCWWKSCLFSPSL